MYHGEVNIAQEELNSFLAVAEELQVKGLTQNSSPSNKNPKISKRSNLEENSRPAAPEQPSAKSHSVYQPITEEVEEVAHLTAVKVEPQPVQYNSTQAITPMGYEQESTITNNTGMEVTSYQEEGYDDYGGHDSQGYQEGGGQQFTEQGFRKVEGAFGQKGFSSLILKSGSGFTCTECGKEFNDQSNCRRHVKISHNYSMDEISCDYCQKTYKNNYSLKDHLRKTHGVYNNYSVQQDR